jgi:hypothetical protein
MSPDEIDAVLDDGILHIGPAAVIEPGILMAAEQDVADDVPVALPLFDTAACGLKGYWNVLVENGISPAGASIRSRFHPSPASGPIFRPNGMVGEFSRSNS